MLDFAPEFSFYFQLRTAILAVIENSQHNSQKTASPVAVFSKKQPAPENLFHS